MSQKQNMHVSYRRATNPHYHITSRRATHYYHERTQSWQKFTKYPQGFAHFRDSGRTKAIIFVILIGLIILSMAACKPERCVTDGNTLSGYRPSHSINQARCPR